MITFYNTAMLSELKNIWRLCFGDSDEYINTYFGGRFLDGKCVVYTQDNIPRAMLVLYDGKIISGSNSRNACYLYGVATHPDFQGRGISTALIEYALKYTSEHNQTAVLTPASDTLVDFYSKRGFYSSFYIKKHNFIPVHVDMCVDISDLSSDEYHAMRENRLISLSHFAWEAKIIGYAVSENNLFGGSSKKLIYNNREYGVLYHISNNTLNVQECTIPDEDLYTCLSALAQLEGCTQISARLTPDSVYGDKILFAMSNSTDINGAYMNIVFD